jgi:predicted RNA-binding protein with PIN domain
MSPALIVDGNNVMGSRPDGWWRDRAGASRRLVEQLGRWAQREREDVLVVFDGRAADPVDAPPGVEVRFAERAGRDAADDVIVAAHDTPRELTVVTSDAGLSRRVRAHGARVTGARAFREQLDAA